VLKIVEAHDLFIGAKCNAINSATGMWMPCTIDKVILPTQDDEMKMLETGDFRCL